MATRQKTDNTRRTKPTEAAIDEQEARDMALFLVRIFGDEAAEVAADRAINSEQAADWRRVGHAVDDLLGEQETAVPRSIELRPLS